MFSITVFLIAMKPAFGFATATQASLRTVWENPFTQTTYRSDNEINSTFYTFPKVIWDGSQYVDYIFNSSDMSAGIGSVYIKICSDHTVFYDPYRTEVMIGDENWNVESYNESTCSWDVDSHLEDTVLSSFNQSAINFERKTTLSSGATLDVSYELQPGSRLKISTAFCPVQDGNYRLVWTLKAISATEATWLGTTENVSAQFVNDSSCSSVQFAGNNDSRCSVDWSDAGFFNETTQTWQTSFQTLQLQKDISDNECKANVTFGDFNLESGQPLILDPTVATFNSTGALDGLVEHYGMGYPPSSGSFVDTSSPYLLVGQANSQQNGGYMIDRSYLSFDTSSISTMAYNMSVNLQLKTDWLNTYVNFNLQVWGGNQPVCIGNLTILNGVQPIYGSSLTTASWGTGQVNLADWNTASYPGNGNYINLTIAANQIDKTGTTQFELNSSRDSVNAPQTNSVEEVAFYSGDSLGNEPKLQVSYYLDKISIPWSYQPDPGIFYNETWLFRNVSTSKAVIALFGGYRYYAIKSIDNPLEKLFGKTQFLDALIENGFSVFTPLDDGYNTLLSHYDGSDSSWVRDLVMYLMNNSTYTQVYLFGFSAGGSAVGYEIEQDYASRISAAVMNDPSASDWNIMYKSSMAKVASSFPTSEFGDPSYDQNITIYYDNEPANLDKEWHNFTSTHGFFDPNCTCSWHTSPYTSGENDSVAVINWFNAYHPPSAPFTPTGSQSDIVNTLYSYTTGTVDPNGQNVSYIFNWGDGTNSTTGNYFSGTNVTCSHYWSNAGSYNVTALAKDSQNSSCWSPPLTVNVVSGGGGCPYVYCWNGKKYVTDNNILPASQNGNGTDTKDYYLLQQPLVPVFRTRKSSVYSLQIGEYETNIDYIDQAKLMAVDCSQGTSIAVTQDGEIFAYQNLLTPISAVDNNGNSELTQISSMNGNLSDPSTYYVGNKGDWLLLDFGTITGPTANLVLRDDRKCSECIYVQVPDGSGGWQNVTVLNPRDYWSIEAVNMTAYLPQKGNFIVRLYWTQTHSLDFVGLDTSVQTPPQVTSAPPALAIHSTLGDVTEKLLYDDEQCVQLVNGQTITVWFILPNQAQGTTRSFIFFTDGYYYTIT